MNWGAEINRQVANATERELEAARSTIAELQKRIGELEAERDQFRQYAHAITKALTGLVGGGSEMFAGRIATGTDREMFKADLPFCVQRIRDRYERSHTALCEAVRREKAAEQALTAERQRREEVRELLQKGIIGNEAGPEMRPRLVVYFERVEDAYKLADFLISIKDAPSRVSPSLQHRGR